MQYHPIWPEELFLDLDRTGPIPLYFQVASRLEEAIRTGEIPAGARLENEIAIAKSLGMSRPTVRRAIQDLVDKGLLVRRRGIGTQVVQGQVTREVELTSLYEDLKSADHNPSTRLLLQEIIPATEKIAEDLGLSEGADVVHIRRQRSTDGVAVAVMENFLPAQFADALSNNLEKHGLYQLLRRSGVTISVAKQSIGARRAKNDESKLLGIDKSGPVLTMQRIAYDNSGRAIEYGTHCYRPDLYSFETTLVAK